MPTSPTAITVRDIGTHFAIPNARVYIDGISRGITDSNGQLVISILVQGLQYTLSVKSSFYELFSSPLAGGSSIIVNLVPSSTPPSVTFILTIYPENLAVGVPITLSNNGTPVIVQYQLGGTRISGLVAGPQTVTGVVPDCVSIDKTFTLENIPSDQKGTIILVKSSDNGREEKQQIQIQLDPDVTSILPSLTNQNPPEFIAPNTGQGTYFTMTQARLYIGNIFIDELNSLQWALQDNKIPIYGYASRFYDTLAQGKSLIQGQFSINFVSEGYLYVTLQEYARTISNEDTAIDLVNQEQLNRLLFLTNKLSNPDPAWTPAMLSNARKEINNLASTLGPLAVDQARSGLNTTIRQQNNNILGLPGTDFSNAVYTDIGFDIVIEYTGAGRVITRRLEDCNLISNETILDHSGSPILDSYGFLARRSR